MIFCTAKRWLRAFTPGRDGHMTPEVADAVKSAYAEVQSANAVIQRIADENAEVAQKKALRRVR